MKITETPALLTIAFDSDGVPTKAVLTNRKSTLADDDSVLMTGKGSVKELKTEDIAFIQATLTTLNLV